MDMQLSGHFSYRKLITYVLPCIAMMVITSVYSIVDGFFVSNIVGKNAESLNLQRVDYGIYLPVGLK